MVADTSVGIGSDVLISSGNALTEEYGAGDISILAGSTNEETQHAGVVSVHTQDGTVNHSKVHGQKKLFFHTMRVEI